MGDGEVVESNNFIIVNNIKLYQLNVLNIKHNYYISKNGDVYSISSNKFLKGSKDKDGYHKITLPLNNGNVKEFRISQLVLYQFMGNPPKDMKDPTSEHIDGNIDNNSINNLCWMERALNASSRKNKGIGIKNHEAKLSEEDVIKIANLIVENHLTLAEIGKLFNVDKSTISNIKRKKNWGHLLNNYHFNTIPYCSRLDKQKQMEELDKLLLDGYSVSKLLEIGFSKTSIYRHKNKIFGSTGK